MGLLSVKASGLAAGSGGGPSTQTPTLNVLTDELYEIIKIDSPKPWENQTFLTDLYVNKGRSLRQISKELGCSKWLVRKQLERANIDDFSYQRESSEALIRKIMKLRERGMSFHKIAARLNYWRIPTRSGEGKWHAKTVRDQLR